MHLCSAPGAEAVEVQPGVVDLEAVLGRQPLGDRGDVALADLLHPPATVARQVVVVLRPARDIAVDVSVLLKPTGHAGGDERLQGAEDRGASDARLARAQAIVKMLRGDLAPCRRQRIGDEQPLARHALSGCGEPIGRGGRVGSGARGRCRHHGRG